MQTHSEMKQLRLLIWLKLRLTYLGMGQSRARIANTVVMLVLFLPVSMLAAWGINLVLETTTAQQHPFIFRDVLALIFVFWVFAPIAGVQLSESYDLTKLFAYPIRCRTIFASAVINSLLDTTFLLTLPTFYVLATHGPTSLIWLRSLLLLMFAIQTVAISQALMLTQFGFLKSRRFRDVATVIVPLFGMAYVVLQQTFIRQLGHNFSVGILDARPWRAANFLAPGWVTTGIFGAELGEWSAPVKAAVLLLLVSGVAFAAASHAITSLYFGDATGTSTQNSSSNAEQSSSFMAPLLLRLSPDISAVMTKELIYLRREPVYKVMALQAVYLLAIVATSFISTGNMTGITFFGGWTKMTSVAFATIFAVVPIAFNSFGSEGAAVTTLFSMPAPRRSFLIGKNIVHGLVLFTAPFITMAVVTMVMHVKPEIFFSELAVIWLCVPLLLAVGNGTSVMLPYGGLPRSQRFAKPGTSSQAGCLTALLRMASFVACIIISLPVAAAILVPIWVGKNIWLLLTVPIAITYVTVIYRLALAQSESWLAHREPEIIARILPQES